MGLAISENMLIHSFGEIRLFIFRTQFGTIFGLIKYSWRPRKIALSNEMLFDLLACFG